MMVSVSVCGGGSVHFLARMIFLKLPNSFTIADDAKDVALAKTELYLLAESLSHFLRMLLVVHSH